MAKECNYPKCEQNGLNDHIHLQPFNAIELQDGHPCSHLGCKQHISHPCEGCGRIGAKGIAIVYGYDEKSEK